MQSSETYPDRKMESQMGSLLRAGVVTSCVLMFAGAVLYLLRHGSEPASYSAFRGEPAALETISGVLHGARTGDARAIIQLGALVMIATPVMRVAFAVVGFSRQRQWAFTLVSLIVLGLLAAGFLNSSA